ncbi:hypothetical protein CLU79DRAFT_785681 [Phycomyces nitens]|nr:hypothetical protein CLU79DRAFT_785566 [Phycomyces nitens]KAI9030734.1 hypothetical protein CLU79DRAFT_785681 [Phycomyces nitens]
MYKSIIYRKKHQVFEQRQEQEDQDITCVHCGQPGHYTNKHYKCQLFQPETASQVGTSGKRKQSYDVKAEKRNVKRQKVSNEATVCKKCKQQGHSSARSPLCGHHILSKEQVLHNNLGDNYKAFTRKLPFDNCVVNTYKASLKSSIVTACTHLRHLIFRAQIFVNHYIIKALDLTVPKGVFKQQFWYTIIQMVNGRKPTSISQCITEACKDLATSYTNTIVEGFEQKLLYFLNYKL